LIILAPLSVAFLIFSISNGVISRAWPAILVAAINVVLMLRRRDLYKPLFKR
jgi:putative oxidoreductase